MADSERSQDQDDEVPDPQKQGDPLPSASRDNGVEDLDSQEPDRDVAPWQSWIRLTGDVLDVLRLVDQVLELINGSGG